jgi:hypothetical protein
LFWSLHPARPSLREKREGEGERELINKNLDVWVICAFTSTNPAGFPPSVADNIMLCDPGISVPQRLGCRKAVFQLT